MKKEGKLLCGIDEAGRGPVIGPLVLAGVLISEDKLQKLEKIGVRDSKLLTPKHREKLYKKILRVVDDWHVLLVEPAEIDLRHAVGTNLNKLEAIKAAEIISHLKPSAVFVDSPEPANAQKFAWMISRYLEEAPEIVAEHKAESKHSVVAAASIIAKVRRDRAVREIEKEIGHPIGSGYQHDPLCREFLENHLKKEHEKHIRKCWITFQDLREKKEQTKLDKFGSDKRNFNV